MKKVALLGDSIRLIGYGMKVPELLGEEYEVYQPKGNCQNVKHTLRMLFDLKEDLKDCEIIHWNNGLWDICRLFDDGEAFTSPEEYLENMIRVAKILKSITPNVIFATTTPVKSEHPYNSNEDIDRYNALVVPELSALGFEINDLNALIRNDVEKYIREDMIHLSEAGVDICAEQVARYIKKFG